MQNNIYTPHPISASQKIIESEVERIRQKNNTDHQEALEIYAKIWKFKSWKHLDTARMIRKEPWYANA